MRKPCERCDSEFEYVRATVRWCSSSCRAMACMERGPRLTCADCGGQMRCKPGSRRQGEARCQPCRRAQPARSAPTRYRDQSPEWKARHNAAQLLRGGRTCADCGKPVWTGKGTLPQGRARCLACRRAQVVPRPPRPTELAQCAECLSLFVRGRRRRYCSEECFLACRRRRGFGAIKKTGDRGYGNEHRKARLAAAVLHWESDPCARCGESLGPMGSNLHYDHNEDRTGYLGFSHAACNVRDGARRGGRVARIGGGRCDAELRIVRRAI